MEHRTGLEMYCVIDEKNNRLRYGYTTGSCAAAAAKAAAMMLLGGQKVEEVPLETPKGILLHLLIEDIQITPDEVVCAVRKDGGDDPDATHGTLVYARVSRFGEKGISIDGGVGVGRVTKPGLSQPIGAAAINETPLRMIRENVEEICRMYGCPGGIRVIIEVPEGEKIAKKTFNPRLGIMGGISILGTSGIVIPMSEASLIASIRLEMKMLVENGARYLVITPGNYGQVFSEKQRDIDLTYSMKCSNYVGETLDMARELGVKGILFIAHIGKFIKVSGGIMNTHSKNADARAELMAAGAIRAGAGMDVVNDILATITTEESVDILKDHDLLSQTMEQIITKAEYYLNKRAGETLEVGAILFSNVHGQLCETKNVTKLKEHINTQIKKNKN
ncbi:MAG: cobalamin biosynthesis protein CbiD [Clostridia bacterium]|nr:cobalamin biosynthesis protein CbiD [Clostridia bacterium]